MKDDPIHERYLLLPSGPLTQGEVWSHLPSLYPPYSSSPGVVITPRCDFAHAKSLVVTYLPLISIDLLMENHGWHALLNREISKSANTLRRLAQPIGAAEWLEFGIPPEQVPGLVREHGLSENLSKHLHTFESELRRLSALQSAIAAQGPIVAESVQSLLQDRDIQRYKEEIIRNSVSDVHFFPPCPPVITTPSIALLRYVQSCPLDLLRDAQSCKTERDWNKQCRERWSDICARCEHPQRLFRVKSPYIEQLVSRFISLFVRVGVRDLDSELVANYAAGKEL
jgi:hypothetical protein